MKKVFSIIAYSFFVILMLLVSMRFVAWIASSAFYSPPLNAMVLPALAVIALGLVTFLLDRAIFGKLEITIFKVSKIFSPIIYAFFSIPAFYGFLTASFFIDKYVEHLSKGPSALPYLNFFIVVSLTYWLANKILEKLEKQTRPTFFDHYRQTAALYFIAFNTFFILLAEGGHHFNRLGAVVLFVPLLLSVWAIFINVLYLYRQHRIYDIEKHVI